MFYGLNNLEILNLSNFNTSNVKDMSYMFSGLYKLEYLYVTNFIKYNV